MEKREITIGAFRGLITKAGKARLQMRTEKGSVLGPNVSYKGDLELSGGAAKEQDLKKVLTISGLLQESAREVKEELGVLVLNPSKISLYRAVYVSPDGKKEDWAFMIPTPPDCWAEEAKTKRKTVDVDPHQLDVLGELNLVVSGKKRMWRMAQAAIFAVSSVAIYREMAEGLLTGVKPDWRKIEYFEDPEKALAQFRKELGLE